MNKKKIYLVYPNKIGTIAPEIYGQFAEHIGGVIYDGIWVGKNSSVPNVNGFRKEIVDKMKAIKTPVIRWPGGCYAEVYDWRDGIGKDRPIRINWWSSTDKKNEPNTVGTHEFMDFCEAIGSKAYFAANLTSVTPMHIRNWMDYCLSPKGSTALALEREKNGHPEPFDIPFWGVGNENWGGGGNMTPEFYANEYRRFSTILNNAFPDAQLFACGTDSFNFDWGKGVLRQIKHHKDFGESSSPINGFAVHYYCPAAGDAVDFNEDEWYQMMHEAAAMDEIINRNWSMICAHGLEKHAKLVIDEWGCWHPVNSGPSKGKNTYEQQSTIRDAVVAAQILNMFNNNCDKIRMANVAQLVNNLHSLFLAGGDKCIETPTYHIYDMYKEHQGAEAVETVVTNNEELESSVSVSASQKNGKSLLTIANLSCNEDVEISVEAVANNLHFTQAQILYCDDMHAHNTFEDPESVKPRFVKLDIGESFILPKTAVIAIHLDNAD